MFQTTNQTTLLLHDYQEPNLLHTGSQNFGVPELYRSQFVPCKRQKCVYLTMANNRISPNNTIQRIDIAYLYIYICIESHLRVHLSIIIISTSQHFFLPNIRASSLAVAAFQAPWASLLVSMASRCANRKKDATGNGGAKWIKNADFMGFHGILWDLMGLKRFHGIYCDLSTTKGYEKRDFMAISTGISWD